MDKWPEIKFGKAVYCGEPEIDCYKICDFCIYMSHTSHGDGEGLCSKHNKVFDWCYACEHFHCMNAGKEMIEESED